MLHRTPGQSVETGRARILETSALSNRKTRFLRMGTYVLLKASIGKAVEMDRTHVEICALCGAKHERENRQQTIILVTAQAFVDDDRRSGLAARCKTRVGTARQLYKRLFATLYDERFRFEDHLRQGDVPVPDVVDIFGDKEAATKWFRRFLDQGGDRERDPSADKLIRYQWIEAALQIHNLTEDDPPVHH